MDKLDRLIAEALTEDDRALLRDLPEPNFLMQSLGILTGRDGWVNVILVIVQTVMFFAAVWAGWRFFAATEVLAALKWGLPAAVLAIVATQLKMALMPRIQADRVLRALRRLELVMARRGQG